MWRDRTNKSHANFIMQIVPCNTAFTRNELYDTICVILIPFLYDSMNLKV